MKIKKGVQMLVIGTLVLVLTACGNGYYNRNHRRYRSGIRGFQAGV